MGVRRRVARTGQEDRRLREEPREVEHERDRPARAHHHGVLPPALAHRALHRVVHAAAGVHAVGLPLAARSDRGIGAPGHARAQVLCRYGGRLFSFSGILMVILQMNQSSCQKTKAGSQLLVPLAVGNEWIYLDSVFENGKLISVTNDTDRILNSSTFEGKTTYIFSDGREMLLKGDSLFQIVSQRSGVKFPTPVFLPTETETKFNYAYGGDVVRQQTVALMKDCPIRKDSFGKNSWNSSKCFRITDYCNSETIFGFGVGVLREKKIDCAFSEKNYSIRTLIAVKFK